MRDAMWGKWRCGRWQGTGDGDNVGTGVGAGVGAGDGKGGVAGEDHGAWRRVGETEVRALGGDW